MSLKKITTMFQRAITLFFFCLCLTGLSAQDEVIVTNDDLVAGEDYLWESDKTYILDGVVALKSGSTLTIEAGTVVKALESPVLGASSGVGTSVFLVARGAQLFANGEPNNPIIFTSEFDDVNDPEDLTFQDRGLWGGILVCGNAPVGTIEQPADLGQLPIGFPTQYGGGDELDNSGVLKYISIRHAGGSPIPGEELNGLTLAGIGAGTEIHHIEAFAGLDDGIAMIGGTVNLKYLNSSFNEDDAFDVDLGWRGKGQFWFGILDEDGQGIAWEIDGAFPDNYELFSKPELYNMTFIGQGKPEDPEDNSVTRSIIFRDAAGGTLANSIFMEFPAWALQVEDRPEADGVDCRQRMEEGDLNLLNNIWWAIGQGNEFSTGPNGILDVNNDYEDPSAQYLVDHLIENENAIVDPMLNQIDWSDNNLLDPRPALGGPAYQDLAPYPEDIFFETVPFKGAFGESAEWLFSWSALDDYAMVSAAFAAVTTSNKEIITDSDQFQLYPNPVLGEAQLNVLPGLNGTEFNLRILDITGRTLYNRSASLTSGQTIVFPTATINPGTYYLQVIGEDAIHVLPFVKAGQ